MTEDQHTNDMARTVEQNAGTSPSDMPDLRIGNQILKGDGSRTSVTEASKTPDRRMQETIWKLKTGLQQESQLLKLLSATQVKSREQASALISDLESILRNVLPKINDDTATVLGLLPEYRQQLTSSPDILPKNQRHLSNILDKDIQAVLEEAPRKLTALIQALKITLTARLNEFPATPTTEARPNPNTFNKILTRMVSPQGLKSMGAIGLSGFSGLSGVDGIVSPDIQPEKIEVEEANSESEMAVSEAIRSVSETLTSQLSPRSLEQLVESMGLSPFLEEIAESYQKELDTSSDSTAEPHEMTDVDLQVDPEAPINPNIPSIPVVIQTLNGESVPTDFTVGQMAAQEATMPALVNRGIEILSRQMPPEIFADFTNLELVVTVPGDPNNIESADNLPLQNGFVMLRLQEDVPVAVGDGSNQFYLYEEGDMFVFNEPGGDLFFIPKTQFFQELSATLANTIDISSFNAENTLFIPDPASNVILVSDRATSTPFALLDLNALAANQGQYAPGVAIALEGIQNYTGMSRDANGQPVAIETAEAPVPIENQGGFQMAKFERPAAAPLNVSAEAAVILTGLNVDSAALDNTQRSLIESIDWVTASQSGAELQQQHPEDVRIHTEAQVLAELIKNAPAELLSKPNVRINQDTMALEWEENGTTYHWRAGMTPGENGYFGQTQVASVFGGTEKVSFEGDDYSEYHGLVFHEVLRNSAGANAGHDQYIAQHFPTVAATFNNYVVHNTSNSNMRPSEQWFQDPTTGLYTRYEIAGDTLIITVGMKDWSTEDPSSTTYADRTEGIMLAVMAQVEQNLSGANWSQPPLDQDLKIYEDMRLGDLIRSYASAFVEGLTPEEKEQALRYYYVEVPENLSLYNY